MCRAICKQPRFYLVSRGLARPDKTHLRLGHSTNRPTQLSEPWPTGSHHSVYSLQFTAGNRGELTSPHVAIKIIIWLSSQAASRRATDPNTRQLLLCLGHQHRSHQISDAAAPSWSHIMNEPICARCAGLVAGFRFFGLWDDDPLILPQRKMVCTVFESRAKGNPCERDYRDR